MPVHEPGPYGKAEEAVKRLREALNLAGLKMPSLRVDADLIPTDPPRALVELGRASVDMTNRLADVIERAVER
jgi:predicted ATPase with chaperone activity